MFFVMVKICEKEVLMDLINLLRLKKRKKLQFIVVLRVNYFKLGHISTVTHSYFQIIKFNWGPEKNIWKKVKVDRTRRIERGKKKQKEKSFFTVITSFHKSSYFFDIQYIIRWWNCVLTYLTGLGFSLDMGCGSGVAPIIRTRKAQTAKASNKDK